MNYEFGKHSYEYSVEYSYNSYVLSNLNNANITVKYDLHTDMLDNDNFWKTLPRRYKTSFNVTERKSTCHQNSFWSKFFVKIK